MKHNTRVRWSFLCKVLSIHRFYPPEEIMAFPIELSTGRQIGRKRPIRLRRCRRCRIVFTVG